MESGSPNLRLSVEEMPSPAHQVLRLRRFGMGGERVGVDDQVAVADRLLQLLPPLGRLPLPEDLLHRPAGERPNELLFLGLAAVLLDGVQHPVGHFGAILMDHFPNPRGIADVEVRLVDDHHVLQPGAVVGGKTCRGHQPDDDRGKMDVSEPGANGGRQSATHHGGSSLLGGC